MIFNQLNLNYKNHRSLKTTKFWYLNTPNGFQIPLLLHNNYPIFRFFILISQPISLQIQTSLKTIHNINVFQMGILTLKILKCIHFGLWKIPIIFLLFQAINLTSILHPNPSDIMIKVIWSHWEVYLITIIYFKMSLAIMQFFFLIYDQILDKIF